MKSSLVTEPLYAQTELFPRSLGSGGSRCFVWRRLGPDRPGPHGCPVALPSLAVTFRACPGVGPGGLRWALVFS